jgi:hypothetical protein
MMGVIEIRCDQDTGRFPLDGKWNLNGSVTSVSQAATKSHSAADVAVLADGSAIRDVYW